MFRKVLIANRGAIAVRICRTLSRLGIESVGVYAHSDRDSGHVTACTQSLSLGDGPLSETYLNVDKLLDAVAQSGAEAVHPGYGFLSENADFARALESRGIAFVGPRAEHLMQFGLKHEARRLASNAGVNLLPGSDVLTSLEEALKVAEIIGYPVMLKSSAGGGGIGMNRCDDPNSLKVRFSEVGALAESAFGDSRVFVERCTVSPRHIEVQAFGDGKGNVAILGDRDCSLQRRHQKIVEECPAPQLPNHVRQRMHEDARALLSSVKYRSAGTVEFLYDPVRESAAFLEVNTRLQVEHGVTELVYNVDIVQWMLELAAEELAPLDQLTEKLHPQGSAIQARLCAEDPNHDFRPTPGHVSQVNFPSQNRLRIDTWLQSGTQVSSQYDSLLAKFISHAPTREEARQTLCDALSKSVVLGIETNRSYLIQSLGTEAFTNGVHSTSTLETVDYRPSTADVLDAGPQTTIQAWPGRMGYWHVGIPPSGPMDDFSFRLGNRILGNDQGAAGLEVTVSGPKLHFNCDSRVLIAGDVEATLISTHGEQSVTSWQPFNISCSDVLSVGKVGTGMRAYILFTGGLAIPKTLGSEATFTLGEIGGLNGQALAVGNVLPICPLGKLTKDHQEVASRVRACTPLHTRHQLRITLGPHCSNEFLTDKDLDTFLAAQWSVHYNSSRTGVRLIGPRPEWARSDGGDAGLHPSNIHDNAYAFGTIDFTGDMPVILGPDGPSLGGFVCPGTVIEADRWKLGQLKAGEHVQFIPVTDDEAVRVARERDQEIYTCTLRPSTAPNSSTRKRQDPIVARIEDMHIRRAAQDTLLIEFGPNVLDLELSLRVCAFESSITETKLPHVLEMTSGIRSLLLRFDVRQISTTDMVVALTDHLLHARSPQRTVPSRVVHLPLSWDDPACREAIVRYTKSVRADAPWCPDNIEFIRRINGLSDTQTVKDIVFAADYFVLGLGDVYLGAPVATPLDPRHRLVTTKYNPARTWTAANSVGIGGAYMCIYGMEGPGGYQFVGRTLQVWDTFQRGSAFDKPWLLRPFDRIRFFEVSAEELIEMREAFPRGALELNIRDDTFHFDDYQSWLSEHKTEITKFETQRRTAFDEELEDWRSRGLLTLESEEVVLEPELELDSSDDDNVVVSPLAGSVWSINVDPGQQVKEGDVLFVIESMKAEFDVVARCDTKLEKVLVDKGQTVHAGQPLALPSS